MQCVARTPSQSFLVLEVMRNLLGCHNDCSPWKQPLKISYLDCDNKTHHITPTHVLTATFLHTRWQGWGQNSQRRTSTTRTCTNTVFAASASCAASVASCAASFVALQAESLASCAASFVALQAYTIFYICWNPVGGLETNQPQPYRFHQQCAKPEVGDKGVGFWLQCIKTQSALETQKNGNAGPQYLGYLKMLLVFIYIIWKTKNTPNPRNYMLAHTEP